MKCSLLAFAVILFQMHLGAGEFKYSSTLPSGKYRIKFKSIFNCNSTTNKNLLRYNLYVFSKGNDTNELRGNITTKTPFDDVIAGELMLSYKDPHGNWIENVLAHKSPNCCSFFKGIMGKAWPRFLTSFGLPEVKAECRIPANTYYAPGLDAAVLENSNLPKRFIYGTYKIRITQTYKNELYGCLYLIVELKRP